MKLIALLISMIAVASCSHNVKMNKNIVDIDERLDSFFHQHLQDSRFPGVQYVLFDSHKLLYEFSGGLARIKDEEKMLPHSLLNVFSTTKIVTAIAILQLSQEGRLSLDDQLTRYLPEMPYKEVTIRQILSHSSGIPDPFLGNFFIHWSDEHNDYKRDEVLKQVVRENSQLKFSPGEKILYSNLGYAILGKIIENLSGLSYEEYVTRHIFDKLGLNTGEINFGDQSQPGASRAYFRRTSILYNMMVLLLKGRETKVEGKWKAIDKPFYFNFPSHGGIMASAREYARIFSDLMKPDSLLLSSATLATLFAEQKQYKDTTLAISWFKGEMQNRPYFYHQGGGMGFVAEVRIYPDDNIGSIILINRTDINSLAILNDLDSEYLDN